MSKRWTNPGPNSRQCTECGKWFFSAVVHATGKASDYRPEVHCPYCDGVQIEKDFRDESLGVITTANELLEDYSSPMELVEACAVLRQNKTGGQ